MLQVTSSKTYTNGGNVRRILNYSQPIASISDAVVEDARRELGVHLMS
jgi:hypothetical protein